MYWIYRIFSIARNTFREAICDRVLYNLVLIFLGISLVGSKASKSTVQKLSF